MRFAVVMLCLVLFTACSTTNTASNAATTWDTAARELDAQTADLQVAQQAGNTQHAAQIREDLIKTCRIYWSAKDAASDAEIHVRTLCSDVGAAFP